jgi:hypothetical protein
MKKFTVILIISSLTIDTSYNKSTREQQKEYAEEVADKIFNFVK